MPEKLESRFEVKEAVIEEILPVSCCESLGFKEFKDESDSLFENLRFK
jgi:hypothetical protein